MSALQEWTANIAGFDVPERVGGGRVSADFFRMAGRAAAIGRTFTGDDSACTVASSSCRMGCGGAASAATRA